MKRDDIRIDRKKYNQYQADRKRARYNTDAEFRERVKATNRKAYQEKRLQAYLASEEAKKEKTNDDLSSNNER